MNLTQLRAFAAVLRTGSFTAAAELLHVTQPAVTSHIRQLEDYYEVSLFHRRGRRVVATQLGEELAEIARDLFSLEEKAADLLLAHRRLHRGALRIAADGPYAAVPLVAAFRARYPAVHIRLSIASTGDVGTALMEEHCDVAVLGYLEPDPRLHGIALAESEIIVFVSVKHPWAVAGRRDIALAELAGEPVIVREPGSTTRRVFVGACEQAGVSPEFVIETTSRETVKEAVAADLGIGVIADEELRPDPRFHPLRVADADLRITEWLVCLARRRTLRVIREFFQLADEGGLTAAATEAPT